MLQTQPLLHTKQIEILWDDMDAYGHVNNAKYFTYMQECRFDWLVATGVEFSPTGRAPVLGATSCQFKHPIMYPAKIMIELYPGECRGKRILFTHIIRDQHAPELIYATGIAEVVWFDFSTKRSIHEPEEYAKLYPHFVPEGLKQ